MRPRWYWHRTALRCGVSPSPELPPDGPWLCTTHLLVAVRVVYVSILDQSSTLLDPDKRIVVLQFSVYIIDYRKRQTVVNNKRTIVNFSVSCNKQVLKFSIISSIKNVLNAISFPLNSRTFAIFDLHRETYLSVSICSVKITDNFQILMMQTDN